MIAENLNVLNGFAYFVGPARAHIGPYGSIWAHVGPFVRRLLSARCNSFHKDAWAFKAVAGRNWGGCEECRQAPSMPLGIRHCADQSS